MKHHFPKICYDIDILVGGVNLLSTFMRNLHDQSEEEPDRFKPNDYLGDGFECFVESIILQFPSDKRICIKDYTPILKDDQGVDGYGYNMKSEIHTVQCKARMDVSSWLKASDDHISNFVAHSMCRYQTTKGNMTVVTTNEGVVTSTLANMYNGYVNVINGKGLKSLVDNNDTFWLTFRDQMKVSKNV